MKSEKKTKSNYENMHKINITQVKTRKMQKCIIKKIKKHSKNMHEIAIETFQKMEREKNMYKIVT